MSLDKLNQIASMVSDLINGHPDKKKQPAQDPEDGDEQSPDEQSKAVKVQKSFRKATGGQKEPGC